MCTSVGASTEAGRGFGAGLLLLLHMVGIAHFSGRWNPVSRLKSLDRIKLCETTAGLVFLSLFFPTDSSSTPFPVFLCVLDTTTISSLDRGGERGGAEGEEKRERGRVKATAKEREREREYRLVAL